MVTPNGTVEIAPPAGLRRRPEPGPPVHRLGRHPRHHHAGLDAAAASAKLPRRRRCALRRLLCGGARRCARSPRPGSIRRTAGSSTRPRRSIPAPATARSPSWCWPSSPAIMTSAPGWRARSSFCRRPRRRRRGPAARRAHREGAAEHWRNAFIRMPYAREGGPVRRHQRHLRDRDHLGALRGVPRRDQGRHRSGDPRRDRARRRRHLPLHPCLPGRPGALLHLPRARRAMASWSRSGTRSSPPAFDAVIASGGTITHHHAVGRDHRPWYDRQRPPLFADGAARRQADDGSAGPAQSGRADRRVILRSGYASCAPRSTMTRNQAPWSVGIFARTGMISRAPRS